MNNATSSALQAAHESLSSRLQFHDVEDGPRLDHVLLDLLRALPFEAPFLAMKLQILCLMGPRVRTYDNLTRLCDDIEVTLRQG